MSFEHKVLNSVSTKPKHCHWWKLWNRHLSIRQYLPLKVSKFWIKTFKLYGSRTGYLWCFLVYTEKKHGPTVESDYSRHPQNSNCSTGTFRTLVWLWTYAVDWQLLQQSRISKEAENRTFHWLCWDTETEQKERPQGNKDVKDKLEKGEIIAWHLGPVTVLKWRDKRNVTIVSTYHNAETDGF